MVDAFSKWVDVQLIDNLTSSSIISSLRLIVKYVGLSINLVTDNGGNFQSRQFDEFLVNNFIRHIRTSPGHHQSNGLVEQVIHELKLFLEKSSFCLQHNTTPSSNGSITSSFIFSQGIRTRLSAQCTETDLPHSPIPAFASTSIVAKVGENTVFDDRSRLVHESDVSPRLRPVGDDVGQRTHTSVTSDLVSASKDTTMSGNVSECQ